MGEIEIIMSNFFPANPNEFDKFLNYWGDKRELSGIETDRT